MAAVTAAVAAAVVMNFAKLNGTLDTLPNGGKIWAYWGETLGLGGLVLLPQVLSSPPAIHLVDGLVRKHHCFAKSRLDLGHT